MAFVLKALNVHCSKERKSKVRVQFTLDTYKSKLFTVETGIDNQPDIKLYKIFGFQELKQ